MSAIISWLAEQIRVVVFAALNAVLSFAAWVLGQLGINWDPNEFWDFLNDSTLNHYLHVMDWVLPIKDMLTIASTGMVTIAGIKTIKIVLRRLPWIGA